MAHSVEAIGALTEPNRRALYDYVVEQREWRAGGGRGSAGDRVEIVT